MAAVMDHRKRLVSAVLVACLAVSLQIVEVQGECGNEEGTDCGDGNCCETTAGAMCIGGHCCPSLDLCPNGDSTSCCPPPSMCINGDCVPQCQTGTKCGTDFPMVSCCNADQCCETEDPDQADRCSTNVFTRKLRGVSLRSLKGALGFTYTCMCSDPTADSCPDGQCCPDPKKCQTGNYGGSYFCCAPLNTCGETCCDPRQQNQVCMATVMGDSWKSCMTCPLGTTACGGTCCDDATAMCADPDLGPCMSTVSPPPPYMDSDSVMALPSL